MMHSFEALPSVNFNLMEFGRIYVVDAYNLQRALDYRLGTQSELLSIQREFEWLVSEPMKGYRRQKFGHFVSSEKELKIAEKIQSSWDIETYAFK